ncbi:MAG TPA: NAD(P)-dependent oxidoreductase [Devosia sp.]|nr:NAD(P)-dependent oxidoreductase [Devosia sp.]
MNVFFFGMGFSSQATALAIREIIDEDAAIFGTTRSRSRAGELGRIGVRSHAFDGRAPGLMLAADLVRSSRVVLSIPPANGHCPVLAHHRQDLDRIEDLEWLCYFSSVGVYDNSNGAWIDESADLAHADERAGVRLKVEDQWREYARERQVPLCIFRIAGIYGPGRSALDKLRDGVAHRIIKKGQVFNRVHVADIGRVTALAMSQRLDGTFNLTDDEPAPPQDLVTFAAELLGVDPPPEIPFEEAELSDFARQFYMDNKRVSNARIKKALGIELLFPTYREGLRNIREQEELPA